MIASIIVLILSSTASAFISGGCSFNLNTKSLKMELDTLSYGAIFVGTLIPALAFVKFVGDQADASRGSLSDETMAKFKRAMMEQPGANFAIPSSEEEELKRQITKAYMQDKDVDVAVLEEKLRKRVQWRKELKAQQQKQRFSAAAAEDDDGW